VPRVPTRIHPPTTDQEYAMGRRPFTTLTTALLSMAALSAAWCGDEEKLTKEQVPPAVLAVLEKAANGNALNEFEKEKKHGATVYTAEFKGADGKEMEITVSADAQLIKIESEGDEKDGKGGKHEHEEK
jgi:hypothetical protein